MNVDLKNLILSDSSFKFVNETGDGVFKCLLCSKKFYLNKHLELKGDTNSLCIKDISYKHNNSKNLCDYCIICTTCNKRTLDNENILEKLRQKRAYRYDRNYTLKYHNELIASFDIPTGKLFSYQGNSYIFLKTLLKSNAIAALNNSTCQIEKIPLLQYTVNIIKKED